MIVSLNTKQDFLKTIQSVTNQNYRDCEIIVVDGGSNDGTIEEIKKREKQITKIIIEKDRGIFDAMNKGIKIANSNWTIFMNSGDIFFNNNILNSIIFNSLNNFDILYGDTVVDKNDYKYLLKGKKILKSFKLMPFSHQSCFVKTNILKQNLFNLNYKLAADFNLFVKCHYDGKNFFYLNTIVALTKPGGVSDLNRPKVLDENIKILNTFSLTEDSNDLKYLKLFYIFKNFIKIIIGKKLTEIFTKFKYRNNLIK